jgi:subtilisin family serine protease
MPIRHAGRLGDFDEALAFYHAYRNKADVISCSWGPFDAYVNELWPLPSLTRLVIDICTNHGRGGRGIPVFFAAGNGNEPLELDGYASYENVIAVAACTNDNEKAWYSDYGENVWVTAPSSGGTLDIFTVDRTGPLGYNATSDYTHDFGGTSSATPLVAGVAALMLSVNPDLTVTQIKEILRDTAVKMRRDKPSVYTDYWGDEYTDEYSDDGQSKVFGWGRIDAGAAVAAARELHSP